MVRRNRSPLSGLSDAELRAVAAQVRDALLQVAPQLRNAAAAGYDPGVATHAPSRGTHSHPHYAVGHHTADAGGLHQHIHTHGGQPGRDDPAEDADHDHIHHESDFGHAPPESDPYAGRGAR